MHIITPEPLSMATQFEIFQTIKRPEAPLLFLSVLPQIQLWCQQSEEPGRSGNCLSSALCHTAAPLLVLSL